MQISVSNPENQGLDVKVELKLTGGATRTLDFALPGDWQNAGKTVTQKF